MKGMLKQEKGINLISLTITIMVILIITGMLIFNAKDSVRMEKVQNLYNDISNLREKVSAYYRQYGDIPAKYEFTNIDNLNSAGVIGANDTGKFYIIDLKALPSLTLNYGREYYRAEEENVDVNTLKDLYIINETSHNIFYVQGISIKVNNQTKIYYTEEANIDMAEVEIKDIPKEQWTGTVNAPKLSQGMIPIKWKDGNWLICAEEDPEWYEYVDQTEGRDGTSKWANIMLSDGKYKADSAETENAKNNETAVKEEELGSMFVWIPRYAYQIETMYHNHISSDKAGKVNIEFLEGTKIYNTGDKIKSGQLANKSGQGNWNEHPAFNFGGKILSGIWVAKFEASSTTETPDKNYGGGDTTDFNIKVLPGKQSWRKISISKMFTNCINMNDVNDASFYGISTNKNEIDPHLIKNDEWGAVAYLAQSSYGRNENQVTPNTNGYGNWKYLYTGYAGEGTSASNSEKEVNKPTNVHYYNTEKGMLASTTGNITGIYDMSGGAWEYVAGYINNGHPNQTAQKELIEAEAKYKNAYKAITLDGAEATAGNDNQVKNYEEMQNNYGDGIWETSSMGNHKSRSWYGDCSELTYAKSSFFVRSGTMNNGDVAGLYNFYGEDGTAYEHGSFRPTLAVY